MKYYLHCKTANQHRSLPAASKRSNWTTAILNQDWASSYLRLPVKRRQQKRTCRVLLEVWTQTPYYFVETIFPGWDFCIARWLRSTIANKIPYSEMTTVDHHCKNLLKYTVRWLRSTITGKIGNLNLQLSLVWDGSVAEITPHIGTQISKPSYQQNRALVKIHNKILVWQPKKIIFFHVALKVQRTRIKLKNPD